MLNRNVTHPVIGWLVALALLVGSSLAMAQSEPSMNQIFEAARSGRVDQAQKMIGQVIASHPNSAKAHFVQAELHVQQGRIDAARTSLATAERLAPGLPFANAEAVSGLRARLTGSGLNGLSGAAPSAAARTQSSAPTPRAAPVPAPAPAAQGSSFGSFWPIILIGGAVALALMMFRRRKSAAVAQSTPAGYNGPQGYGNNAAAAGMQGTPNTYNQAGQPQPYAQPGQPGQSYPPQYGQPQQPQGSGLGGKVMGGLATGAAIGAGMMAAQAIGRSMTGGNDAHRAQSSDQFGSGAGGDASIPAGDLGGNNFGIQDTGWDDSGSSMSSADVGGGDWDS